MSDTRSDTRGIGAARRWVASEFAAISEQCGGCLTIETPSDTVTGRRVPKPTEVMDILAIQKGATDPDRVIVISGHIDSRVTDVMNATSDAPGANDDGSGVTAVIEAARVLSKHRFPATLVFAVLSGEEQGLLGGKVLADYATRQGWHVEADLNNDIVGNSTGLNGVHDASYVRVFSEGIPGPATLEQVHTIQNYGYESDSISRELARAIEEVGKTYFKTTLKGPAFHPVLEFRRDRFGRGGDHTSFNAEGFSAVRFTEWQENFNHQHQTLRTEMGELPDGTQGIVEFGDYLKYIDKFYIANVARLNAACLATFAAAPGIPTDVHIPGGSTDNFSVITWKAPAGAPTGTTYEVVWRPTEAPAWTNVQSAGSALTLKLAVSKDTYVFGVRSVDAAGHRSPTVAPMPIPGRPMSGTTLPRAGRPQQPPQ
jgi:hypothetical protein